MHTTGHLQAVFANPRTLAAAALFAGLLASGCTVLGSGHPAREERDTPPFSAVQVSSGLDAIVSLGSLDVVVEGDDNLVPLVQTDVFGDVLHVVSPDSVSPVVPLRITVQAPTLTSIGIDSGGSILLPGELTGDDLRLSIDSGGSIVADDIRGGDVCLSIDSGGEMIASGEAERLLVSLSSGGELEADGILARDVVVNGESGGEITVTATDSIRGSVSSGVTLRVFGNPPIRDIQTSSGGSVEFEP